MADNSSKTESKEIDKRKKPDQGATAVLGWAASMVAFVAGGVIFFSLEMERSGGTWTHSLIAACIPNFIVLVIGFLVYLDGKQSGCLIGILIGTGLSLLILGLCFAGVRMI